MLKLTLELPNDTVRKIAEAWKNNNAELVKIGITGISCSLINCYSFFDNKWTVHELKKKWRRGFDFSAEYGYEYDLNGLGYTFCAYYNEYVFREKAVTIEEAELLTYNNYLKRRSKLCKKNHKNAKNCERKGYTNGCGFCKTCGIFVSDVFSIEQFCVSCGARTNWHIENGKWWCKNCVEEK